MTDTELHDGFSLDLKSPSCDILTQSRGTSVVDMNKVVESIALLESISLDRVEESSLQDVIYSTASILLDFLQSFTDARSVHHTVLSKDGLGRILRLGFLSRLFEHRHVCNLMAADVFSPQNEPSVFISWVDIFIARLGEAILWIGGQGCVLQNVKCSRSAEELALDAFMNSPAQKEQLVRAASQLPVTWQATVAVSGSRQVSEAARRLSLTLVFGAYVLCPKLVSELDKQPYRIMHDSNLVQAALQEIISHFSSEWLSQGDHIHPSAHPNPCGADIIRKCQYAMVVSLFAQLELSRETTEARSFRPSTLGVLIMLIEYVMFGYTFCESIAPIRQFAGLETVNPNHCRLLGWESTLPWCWMVWGGDTSVYFGTVTQITVTWLQHFAVTDADIERIGEAAPLPAMTAFLSLITHPLLQSYDRAKSIVYKACYAISHLARRHYNIFDDTLMIKTYQTLFMLLLSLGFEELDMSSREVILEFIVWLPRRLTEIALPLNLDNISVSEVIDDGVPFRDYKKYLLNNLLAIERVMNAQEVEGSRRVKTSLEILILLAWSRIPGASYMAEKQSFVDHLLSMLDPGSWWDKRTRETGIVLLGCMAGLVPEFDQPLHQSTVVCTSIISYVPSDDLTMAAAIAVYIHGVAKLEYFDSILLIEVWDYLRDTMFIILGKCRQPDDNLHHLASLAQNTICSALSLILAHLPGEHVGVLINSPWTFTLYNELRNCSQASFREDSVSTKVIIDTLLEQIDRLVNANPKNRSLPYQQSCIPARLLFHRSENGYNLVGIAVE